MIKVLDNMPQYSFDDRYYADIDGRVYLNKPSKNLEIGYQIKHFINKYGYVEYNLVDKYGKYKHIQAHRIVACLFIDNPNNKPYVNHLDGDKLNNNIYNLEWCTASENERHSYRVLGKKNPKNNQGKIGYDYNQGAKEVAQYSLEGELVKVWFRPSIAELEGGFNAKLISACCNERQNTHKGFIWKYI